MSTKLLATMEHMKKKRGGGSIETTRPKPTEKKSCGFWRDCRHNGTMRENKNSQGAKTIPGLISPAPKIDSSTKPKSCAPSTVDSQLRNLPMWIEFDYYGFDDLSGTILCVSSLYHLKDSRGYAIAHMT
jgi:hypothetical protein